MCVYDLKINVSKAIPLHAIEALGGEGCSFYSFMTSAVDGSE
jgi:hypothetical protein